MFCTNCGTALEDTYRYCHNCGRSTSHSAAAAPPVGASRLIRPRRGRMIAGVCAGFANYFDADVALVRLLWLLLAIFTGVGFVAYVVAWIVMPNQESCCLPPEVAPQRI